MGNGPDILTLHDSSADSDSLSLAQLDAAALILRQQLKKQKRLSHCYFVDAVLAELQHGRTLNSELFAIFKKLTLLCCIALTHVNLANGITQDGTINAALRNVRLAADQRRGSLLILLSGVDMRAPLETLIMTLADLAPGLTNNTSLTNQVDHLARVLERLATLRSKQQRGGSCAHRLLERQQLEFIPLSLLMITTRSSN